MIPESLCNRVYFSALLSEVCPVTYKGLADVLDRYGVPFSLLKGTKDIWCRDYMPLQMTAMRSRTSMALTMCMTDATSFSTGEIPSIPGRR